MRIIRKIAAALGMTLCCISMLSAQNRPELIIPAGHTGRITSASYTADGRYILTADEDHTACVWDAISGDQIYVLQGSGIEATADSRYFITWSSYGYGKIYEAATGRLLSSFGEEHARVYPCVAGGRIVLELEGVITLTSIPSGKTERQFNIGNPVLRSLECSADGQKMLTLNRGDSCVRVWDLNKGKMLWMLRTNKKNPDAVFDASGQRVIISDPGPSCYNASDGSLHTGTDDCITANEQTWKCHPQGKNCLECYPGFSDELYLTDPVHKKRIIPLTGMAPRINALAVSPDGLTLVSVHEDVKIRLWDLLSGRLKMVLDGGMARGSGYGHMGSVCFSPDGQQLISVYSAGAGARVWECSSGKLLKIIPGLPEGAFGDYPFSGAAYSPDGSKLAIFSYQQAQVVDARNFEPLFRIEEDGLSHLDWSPGGHYLYSAHVGLEPMIWRVSDWSRLPDFNTLSQQGYTSSIVSFSDDDQYLLADFTGIQNVKQLWQLDGWKQIGTDPPESVLKSLGFAREARPASYPLTDSVHFTSGMWPDRSYTYQGSQIICFSLPDKNICYRSIALRSDDYVSLLESGYYSCTPEAAKLLRWKKNDQHYGFTEWDMQYNRPDLVMKALGVTDTLLLNVYRGAWLRRLGLCSVDTSLFDQDFTLPQTEVLNLSDVEGIQADRQITLRIKVRDQDPDQFITRLFVKVNACPLGGSAGIEVDARPGEPKTLSLPLTLSSGRNRISVSCMNNRGAESLKVQFTVDCFAADSLTAKTWFVGIGVSEYLDSAYNLRYAVKDARDMAGLFSAMHAEVDTLFDREVSRENILNLKEKLMQTGVDDRVVVYLAGHGLLDSKNVFYYAVRDMDFSDPAREGLSYNELEGLFDGIPARRKLLLLDACHSGIVDPEKGKNENEGSRAVVYSGKEGDVSPQTARGVILKALGSAGAYDVPDSFLLMQELFVNLPGMSGTMVISAAEGSGYALESGEWNNGVFTYCLLKGFIHTGADRDGDGQIRVSELKSYVSSEVRRLTGGIQKPEGRHENYEDDWIIR